MFGAVNLFPCTRQTNTASDVLLHTAMMATATAHARDEATSVELGRIARLAQPIAIAQLGLVSMGLVDTAILGRVNAVELAGASVGRNIGFAAQTMSIGIAMALEPLASQAIGAREPGKAWASLGATSKTLGLVWVPSMIVAFALTLPLSALGLDDDVIARARVFLIAQAPGLFFFSMFLSLKTFLQAHGSTRPALIGSAVANVINFALCNVLVRGDDALAAVHLPRLGFPALGALGAGFATSFAAMVLVLVLWLAASTFRPATKAPPVAVRTVLKLGLPSGLHMLAEIGAFALVSVITGRLGKATVAANQIALGLASFTFMAALGVSGATAVRVGHHIGAGESPRRSGLLGIGLGAIVMSVGAIAFALFPRPLMALFTNDDVIITLGARLLRVAAIFQLFDGVQAVGAGALRGAGDVRYVLIAGVCAYWVVGVPLALLFGFTLDGGAVGMWWGLSASLMTAATAFFVRFLILSRRGIKRV